MLNELAKIIQLVTKAYDEMKYKLVVKHAYSEMLSLKEAYMIGTQHKGNPAILFKYLETLLQMLNPLIPHFCQYQWQHVIIPRL
jgi:leucyl-tRNA synthetase